jgi:hypothetical protein
VHEEKCQVELQVVVRKFAQDLAIGVQILANLKVRSRKQGNSEFANFSTRFSNWRANFGKKVFAKFSQFAMHKTILVGQ